jgi:hypothetical protein
MTSRAQKLENAETIRALIGFGAGCVAAVVAFVGFWLIAASHGALDRFGDAHTALDIVFGVSVMMFGCIPAALGAFWMVMPDSQVRAARLPGQPRGRLVRSHTSTREACIWIAAGCGYAAVIGSVIQLVG